MSPDVIQRRQKVINAFKGFIIAHKLKPIRTKAKSMEPKYKPSLHSYFSNDKKENLQLYYAVKPFNIVLDVVEKLYPNQTDSNLISNIMFDVLGDWITEGRDSRDQSQLEESGSEFLSRIESAIQPRLLFIPIEGLKFVARESLAVGNCLLHANNEGSDFIQVIKQDGLRHPESSNDHTYNSVKSYFTCEITAHPNRAIKRSVEEAHLSLNILRLYRSSYYFHEHARSVVKRMGLFGSLHMNEQSHIFYVNPLEPISDQYPGGRMSRVIHRDFEINNEFIKGMGANGLEQINYFIQSARLGQLATEEDKIARRLQRAITWFAKATSARSKLDGYLMYAIAIEALLSEDRTPQETYALQMAALVSCNSDNCVIYPVGGYLSSEFAKRLKESESLNDRFNIMRERILKLFSYRNRIAHGAMLNDEVRDENLLDFETIVKNTILSFLKCGWESFGDFKTWVNQSVRFDFVPCKDNFKDARSALANTSISNDDRVS